MAPLVAVIEILGVLTEDRPKASSSAGSPSGVDVAWALTRSTSSGPHAGLGECHPGGADSARAARRRQRDVVRVGSRAVAAQLGQDLDTAPACMAQLFEYEHAGALGDDEAVATFVERSARALWIVVAR